MENIGLPQLTSEQIEQLCTLAEEAARQHILSQIPSKSLETLNISAQAEGEKPIKLSVEVEITLTPQTTDINTQKLAKEAVKEAFKSADKYLKELKCRSQR